MPSHPELNPRRGHGLAFRLVQFLTRFQLRSHLLSRGGTRLPTLVFAVLAGGVSLGTITAVAALTRLPLLFPPLAPSAFILFHRPLAPQASPRNVLMSHALAMACGLVSLQICRLLTAQAGPVDPGALDWTEISSITLAMAAITGLMAGLHCAHPPAAATALIAAMGYLETPLQAVGLLLAAVLLVTGALAVNRLLGGLPYPLWRHDPRAERDHRELAGIHRDHTGYWQAKTDAMLQRRPAPAPAASPAKDDSREPVHS